MINFSNIIIADSFASSPEISSVLQSTSQSGLMNFVPLILIFAVFYFLLIRPQQRKFKDHQNTLKQLKVGDKVYTNSGILGTIKSIDDKENLIDLEISGNVVIKIFKQNISDLVKTKLLATKSQKNK